jgi:hypothetical protein
MIARFDSPAKHKVVSLFANGYLLDASLSLHPPR